MWKLHIIIALLSRLVGPLRGPWSAALPFPDSDVIMGYVFNRLIMNITLIMSDSHSKLTWLTLNKTHLGCSPYTRGCTDNDWLREGPIWLDMGPIMRWFSRDGAPGCLGAPRLAERWWPGYVCSCWWRCCCSFCAYESWRVWETSGQCQNMTKRKNAVWLSKNCQKLDIFFKKIAENFHLKKIAIGNFFYKN